ncbi:MAG: hypothetical protein WC273_12705 [Dehalococcoidia bacterium]
MIAAAGIAVMVVGAVVAGWRQWRSGALACPAERDAAKAECRELIERAGVRALNR